MNPIECRDTETDEEMAEETTALGRGVGGGGWGGGGWAWRSFKKRRRDAGTRHSDVGLTPTMNKSLLLLHLMAVVLVAAATDVDSDVEHRMDDRMDFMGGIDDVSLAARTISIDSNRKNKQTKWGPALQLITMCVCVCVCVSGRSG